MKTNRHQFCAALFAAMALVLLTSTFVHADNIYVASERTSTIVKIDSSGQQSIFANGAQYLGIVCDNKGNLYGHSGDIYKFDSSGHRSLFAASAFPGDWDEALAVDQSGNLYEGHFYGNTIEKFSPGGTDLGTFATGVNYPLGSAFDSSGNLYVGTYYDGTIVKIDSSGHGTIFASGLAQGLWGLAFDSSGNLYAAVHTIIYKFDSSGNQTIFNSGATRREGLAFDSSGNLYAANVYDGTISKFDPSGHETIVASGLTWPNFIAVQTPEPATMALLGLGGLLLRRMKA